jgi:hypothetical protein
MAYGKVWDEQRVKSEIKVMMNALNIERMPTAPELQEYGRNDLHCIISKTKKYKGWADELGIPLKSCDTRKGNEYEDIVKGILLQKGYEVESMSTRHPYDLLVNGNIKVDVKVGGLYKLKNSDCWTFALAKNYPTCDIYICVAETDGEIERILVIPSMFAKIKTISIGKVSKYDKYIDRYDYIDQYQQFYNSMES